MKSKPRLLLVYFTNLENQPRAYKQWLCLKDYFEIIEVSFGPSGRVKTFFEVKDLPKRSILLKCWWAINLLRGDYSTYLKRYSVAGYSTLEQMEFDLVIAHDMESCPLAFSLAGNTPVIIDLHEYLPEVCTEELYWRVFFQRPVTNSCKKYLPKAAGLLTVSEGLAEKYQQKFGVIPAVNYNSPPFVEQEPSSCVDEHIDLVHHGVAAHGRCIHVLFELLDKLDTRFTLHTYLVGKGEYYEKIRDIAISHPRVVWHEPIPLTAISRELNQYDIGITLLPSCNANHELTIGNKIFEFIQARLAVAAWPTKGIKSIVDKYNTGFCSEKDDVATMATRLNSLTVDELALYKSNSHTAAKELTAEKSMEVIVDMVRELVPDAF